MATNKRYFHDHLVLLLLSVNAFLALAGCALVLVRLSTSHGTGYIVQYRENLGINAFRTGSVLEILSFAVFLLLTLGLQTGLSLRTYRINRHLALSILALGILLFLLAIIISNALLVLR